jgi:hypothetical protein
MDITILKKMDETTNENKLNTKQRHTDRRPAAIRTTKPPTREK